MPEFSWSAAERKVVAQDLGNVEADVTLALNLLAALQTMRPVAHKLLAYSLNTTSATAYFTIGVRGLARLTADDASRLHKLSDRVRDVTVTWLDDAAAGSPAAVKIVVQRAEATGLVAVTQFAPYAPPRRRKRRFVDVDWAAAGVTDGDDQRRITAIIDDVYHVQDRMPDVQFYFDHLGAGTTTSESATDDDATEAVVGRAQAFVLCFTGMPDLRFGAFAQWLRERYGGEVVGQVYCELTDPATFVVTVLRAGRDVTEARVVASRVQSPPRLARRLVKQ